MRIHFETATRPKKIAKRLKKTANERGIVLKLSKAQQSVARMYGYAHWHELHASLGRQTPSPLDGDISEAEVIARRAYQASTLAIELAVEIDIAVALVETVSPTGPLGRSPLKPDRDGEDDAAEGDQRYW
jgi:hypothetical protein